MPLLQLPVALQQGGWGPCQVVVRLWCTECICTPCSRQPPEGVWVLYSSYVPSCFVQPCGHCQSDSVSACRRSRVPPECHCRCIATSVVVHMPTVGHPWMNLWQMNNT